jgi:hypothetical protein
MLYSIVGAMANLSRRLPNVEELTSPCSAADQ